MKKKLTIFSGAGVSAESGIPTFRDGNGLWENYKVEDVATPEGWKKDRKVVLQFYNERRKKLHEVQPNEAHNIIAELEKHFDVTIITQNIDDLHERAGSTNVLHLHGQLLQSRSTFDPSLTFPCTGDINEGDKCPKGSQLRPDVVWFGESVQNMNKATEVVTETDYLVVVGTSLQVYPAAQLPYLTKSECVTFYVDPVINDASMFDHGIKAVATVGMAEVKKILLKEIIDRGADVSNFGDPSEWQKDVRKED